MKVEVNTLRVGDRIRLCSPSNWSPHLVGKEYHIEKFDEYGRPTFFNDSAQEYNYVDDFDWPCEKVVRVKSEDVLYRDIFGRARLGSLWNYAIEQALIREHYQKASTRIRYTQREWPYNKELSYDISNDEIIFFWADLP